MDLLTNPIGLAFVVVLGASVGSFLNVVVYRIPAGLSLLHPPSRCPSCHHRLGVTDNIPIVGWLWLGGRCRYCRTAIAVRYPLVESATLAVFLLVAAQFGLSWYTLSYWILSSLLLALALIDWDTLTLPDPLTRFGVLAGLAFQGAIGFSLGGWIGLAGGLLSGLLGMAVGIWLLDAIAIAGSWWLGKTAMGAGDSKLAAAMGAWLGVSMFLLAGFLACALGAIAGAIALGMGWLDRQQPMPFGPFLALGTFVAALWGDRLLALYFNTFFQGYW